MRYSFAPFMALAISFIAIGIKGQRAFIYIGIAFLVISLVLMRKLRS